MQLNNRELSVLIWTSVFFAWALSQPTVRQSLTGVLRTVAVPAVSVSLAAVVLYVGVIVYGLQRAGLWRLADAKDTVLWLFGFALVSSLEAPAISRDPSRLKAIVLKVCGIGVVIEFGMTLFVMSLWAELLVVPCLAFLGALIAVAETRTEDAQVARVLRFVQAVAGLSLGVFVLTQFWNHLGEVASLESLRQFAFPVVLSILYVPFLYSLALYVAYDEVMRLIGWLVTDPDVRAYARRRTVGLCTVRLWTLGRWSRAIAGVRFQSRASVDIAVSGFRSTAHAA